MAIAILQNAGAGKPGQHQEVNITENGMMILAPDPGYSLDYASLNVDVKPGEQKEIPEINENGEQTVDIDFGTMTVGVKINANVPSAKGNTELIDGSITSYEIPEGTEKIRDCCFYGCNEMTYVKIPESITEIGREAFEGCLAMKKYDLTRCTVVPKIGDDSICTDGDPKILVPAELYNDFCEGKNWKEYVEHFECDALERVKTGSFSEYLNYEDICTIYQTINKDNPGGIIKNDQYKYVRILSSEGKNEILVGGYIGIYSGYFSYTAGKYLVIKYRSKLAADDEDKITDYIEVWATTANKGKFENGDQFSVHVQRDGRWHTIVLDVESSLGENAQYTPGSTLRGFRIDVFNQQNGASFATNDSYFDIAYVGMCDDRGAAIAADPDYSGAEFDCYDLSSMLCGDIKTPSGESYALIGSEVRATPSGMNYVHIDAEINYSANDRGEVYSYIYREDAVLPNVGKYAAVLYTGLDVGENGGLVQVWKSSNNSNVNGQNPNRQIKYSDCVGAGKDSWRYGVAELSGTDYTEDVCRSVRFDYIDGYDEWNYDPYNVTLNIAFLKFFESADEAAAYCKAYMKKYGLWEET